ncbi:MAG: MFS transporter [Pseudomonadota bacterium]
MTQPADAGKHGDQASSPSGRPSSNSTIRSFPATFWVANLMELFERAAYYGMNALLARYLTDKTGGGLGFEESDAGVLQSMVYAFTYVVPILGGALADRYGYRRALILAFSILSTGYFLSGQVTGYWTIFATLLVMATGAGLFKPIISGTIARTTNERNSGFGFGVYYWMINVGALIAPFVAGYLRTELSWRWVFMASSAYCALMLIPAVFVYREPPRPESRKSLREVLASALTVLSDSRFMLLILVYSCFWVLYFQNFGTVLWYLRDFVDPAPINAATSAVLAKLGVVLVGLANAICGLLNLDCSYVAVRPSVSFDAEHVTVINAGTIVLLQVLVSAVVRNRRPLFTMVSGILIGSIGFLVLALSGHVFGFVLGIAVFSIGEMTCHPKYYSYIGLIAPADKKAVYMGYAFLYGVVGALVGANLGGEAYTAFLAPLRGRPDSGQVTRLFWLVFAVLGLVTAVAMFGYHRLFGEDTAKTRSLARRVMLVVYGLLVVVAVALVVRVAYKYGSVPTKTKIQAGIMMLMGLGGLWSLFRGGNREPTATGGP